MEPLQRLFVGVPLPGELKDYVHGAQELLPRVPGLRLLPEEQWHVTVAFLGEVDEVVAGQARAVVEAVPGAAGGESHFRGFLMLPSQSRARVVALAVSDEQGVWAGLHRFVVRGLCEAGIGPRETRPFRPHLTVARLKAPGTVRPKSDIGAQRFSVESVCLYRSELSREGARYTVVTRTCLENRSQQSTG